jgi:GntR family transcriptional regulator
MSTAVKFAVDVEGPLAVYVQIENQIQFAIASGRFEEGDPVPSGREMSEMVGVNPNTVNKAYRDLEILGLLHTRRGIGVVVAEGAQRIARSRVLPAVNRHLASAVAECLACGVKPSEIHAAVSTALKSDSLPYRGGDREHP